MKIFSIVLILIFMADPVWGLLSKSAVDPETVEGAIDRLIAVHEAAETSHLGAGESLETHKASDVIDHKAGSVLADKLQASGYMLNTTFESLTPYVKKGDVTNSAWPGIEMFTTYGTPKIARLASLGSNARKVVDYNYDFVIQFSFIIGSDDFASAYFRFGQVAESTFSYGVALERDGTNGRVRWKKVGSDVYSGYFALSLDQWHTFRISYSATDEVLTYYLDGVYVGELAEANAEKSSGGVDFNFWLTSGGAGDMWGAVEYLNLSRG